MYGSWRPAVKVAPLISRKAVSPVVAMLSPNELTLAVLAGGQGLRLHGRAKALINIGGETVLARLLRLERLVSRRLLIANHPEAVLGLPAVRDVVVGKGAPGGVVTALLSATTPWVLVVACDMPFVEARHVEALLSVADQRLEVVSAARAGSLEPLLGVYRSGLGTRWRGRLELNPSLRSLVHEAAFAQVELDPSALDSLNTPEDLARVGAQ